MRPCLKVSSKGDTRKQLILTSVLHTLAHMHRTHTHTNYGFVSVESLH